MKGVLLAVALLIATLSKADVRIVAAPGGPDLSVQPNARGVWTPHGGPAVGRGLLLNAGGDLTGDGFPAHARKCDGLVAAWLRPLTSSLMIADAPVVGPVHVAAMAIQPATGRPMVLGLDGAWLILWQGIDGPTVMGTIHIAGPEVPEAHILQPGLLIAARVNADSLVIVSLDSASNELVIGEYVASRPYPVPLPPITSRMTRLPLGGSIGPTEDGVPFKAPCVEELEDGFLLAWPAGRNVIARVRIDRSHTPRLDYVRASNGSCSAMLNAAR